MKLFFVLAVLVMGSCWTYAHAADPIYPEGPMDLRVTGTLLPFTQSDREDQITVSIFVQDTPRLLRVGKVEELTAFERQRAVEHGILLRQVRFYGPEPLLEQLQQPAMLGKVVTIEGRLDAKARRFLVRAVQGHADETPQSPTAE